MMINEYQSLTLSDFEERSWDSVTAEAESKVCSSYQELYRDCSRGARVAGDETGHQVFRLLATVTCYRLRPGRRDDPFVTPIVEIPGPKQLIDSDLTIIGQLFPKTSDFELCARLADIVWVAKKQYKAAVAACDAYMQSAQYLGRAARWNDAALRFHRAMQIAMSLNDVNRSSYIAEAISESLFERHEYGDEWGYAIQLLDILLESRIGDPLRLAQLAKDLATDAERANHWPNAQYLWDIASKWYQLADDPNAAHQAMVRSSGVSVSIAEEINPTDAAGYLIKAHHLQEAIESYRQIGERERADELQRLMLEMQRQVESLMPCTSIEVDMSTNMHEAEAAVRGKPFRESILALAMLMAAPSKQELRDRSDQYIQEFPVLYMFDTIPVDADGRPVARMRSRLSGSDEDVEQARRADMHRIAAADRNLRVFRMVEPARRQILLDHSPTAETVMPFCENHPFIPQGREEIYAQGLAAGFDGDFLQAVHLLIPQVENSIRYLFQRMGIIESTLGSDGLQEAQDLNVLLYREELKRIFPENLIFDLQGLLVERFGSNLRNRLAHGLLNSGECNGVSSIYLWWLVLHILALPIISKIDQPSSSEETAEVEQLTEDQSQSEEHR